jgi:putative transposase
MPYTTKRCVRYNEPGHAHELTFSCYKRLPLLASDRTRLWLAEAIDAAHKRLKFDLWAYAFMPEHVHLLVYPRQPDYEISSILWKIKRPVARQAIYYLARRSPGWLTRLTVTRSDGRVERRFWQGGGGYDRNLMEPATVRRVIEYIHGNPVRRGLVERPEEWPWSSASYYAESRSVWLPVDGTLSATIGD